MLRKLFVKQTLYVVLLSLVLVFIDSDHPLAQTQTADNLGPRTLMVLGDSLSAAYGLEAAQGWVALLAEQWQQQGYPVHVVNAAISGETSEGGLARLPRLLEQHQPTHVLIELGGNNGLQGHPIATLRENLTKMVELVKAQGAQALLQDMQIPTNYGPRYTQLFADSFALVAEATDIPLIPFFLTDIALERKLMQKDGIHPNAAAQPLIAEFMHAQLTPLLWPSRQAH